MLLGRRIKQKQLNNRHIIWLNVLATDYAVLLGDQKLESHVGYVMNITRGIA